MHYEPYPPREADPALDPTQNTRDWIDLKLNSLKGEMRVWFIAAIAGNHLLDHVSLSPLLGYAGTGAAVGTALIVKFMHVR